MTGGSQGFGKSLAILLARKGAHVTVVARTKSQLEETIVELKQASASPSQKFCFVPCDVSDYDSSCSALKTASDNIGKVPDCVFTCAGMPRRWFIHTQDCAFQGT